MTTQLFVSPHDTEFTGETLVDLLHWRAKMLPRRIAFTFLEENGDELSITYSELDRDARRIAALLADAGGIAGDRAFLLFPSGLDFVRTFFGCLYAGVAAIPIHVTFERGDTSQLEALLGAAQPRFLLTSSAGAAKLGALGALFGAKGGASSLNVMATDDLKGVAESQWRERPLLADAPTFIQFTSGSTGMPKGVALSHQHLVHNSLVIYQKFGLSPESRMVSWLPLFHNMGLIGTLIQPIYGGFQNFLMAPTTFLKQPLRWLQAISQHRATISGGPNFAYDLCVLQSTPELREGLDLSCLETAMCGAEPVRPETIDHFHRAFSPVGFQREAFSPAYGLAEATLIVSAKPLRKAPLILELNKSALEKNRVELAGEGDRDIRRVVSCGQSFAGQRLLIVHPEARTQCPPGEIGEIWIHSPCVSSGYWNNPAATEQTFHGTLSKDDGRRYLKTGDLGFLRDGELFITGRIKDVIIISGRNLYPQDIERTVGSSHPDLHGSVGAVFSVDDGQTECLVAVQELDPGFSSDAAEIIDVIQQQVLAQHGVPLHAIRLIQPGTLPRTGGGKVQRFACRQAFLEDSLTAQARWDRADVESPDETVPRPTEAPKPPEPAMRVRTEAEISGWIKQNLAQRMGIGTAKIDTRHPLARYGLSSVEAVALAGELEKATGRAVPSTLIWEYPTIDAIAKHLSDGHAEQEPEGPVDPACQDLREPIAVIGLACRFPGGDTPETFWELLRNGVDAIDEVPAARHADWRVMGGDPTEMDSAQIRWGGWLDDVERFDARFFGISPLEARYVDPQQRLLLEVAWEALEDAGVAVDGLAGSRTGVFVGVSNMDYARGLYNHRQGLEAYVGTGNAASIVANRLSYVLDLMGPSVALDTACSSSLVTTHLACDSLRTGQCDLALSGGVNLILSPDLNVIFSKAGMLSPEGRCKTFDASANGYVRGEGCGVVVLKRLTDAQRDGDRIFAVVHGSAVNQDGRSNGLTAPNGLAQQSVIRTALRTAGMAASDIGYIEAHGTGTSLGDPIEVRSLSAVFAGGPKDKRKPCYLGSVKTNIGHLEPAAGIAGLIKTVLSLHHGAIPPHLHFNQLNPKISLDGTPFKIPTAAMPWRRGETPRYAGISSFGFGGTNAHVIIGEAPATTGPEASREKPPEMRSCHLLCLSAKDEETLGAVAARYLDLLERRPDTDLGDLCYTANSGRTHHDIRAAVTADSPREFGEALGALARGKRKPVNVMGSNLKPVFLFTGQGAQFPGMTRRLYDTSRIYRKTLDECRELLRGELETDLFDVLFAESEDDRINQTLFTQPALFAVEYALARLWISWGIEPAAVTGHSIGELVAACIAGVLQLPDALKLVAARARLMDGLSADGGMTAVMANEEDIRSCLGSALAQLDIAGYNTPGSLVLSGEKGALAGAVERLREAGHRVRELKVSHAFHSRLMDPMLEPFGEVCASISMAHPYIPLVSNLTGELVETTPAADYWVDHVRKPVRFAQGVLALYREGHRIFLEVGPREVLSGMVVQSLGDVDEPYVTVPSLKAKGTEQEDEWKTLLNSLGILHTRGVAVDWEGFDRYTARSRITLPTYPFKPERYWYERKDKVPPASTAHQRVMSISEKTSTIGMPGGMSSELLALFQEQAMVLRAQNEVLSGRRLPATGAVPAASPGAVTMGVHEAPQEPESLKGVSAPPTEATAPAHVDVTSVQAEVSQAIAKVSAFSAEQLSQDQRLMSDLNFDSLMIDSLIRELGGRFPDMAQIKQEELFGFLAEDLPVGKLTRYVLSKVAPGAPDAIVGKSEPTPEFSAGAMPLGEPESKRAVEAEIPEGAYLVDRFPEYLHLKDRLNSIKGQNPYFRVHESVAGDTTVIEGREMLNFSTYNYVGLSGHPKVVAGAKEAIDRYGASVSASRIVSGEKPIHRELEREIADFVGAEDAIVYLGGHQTNETTIGHLFGPDDLILHDDLSHNSIMMGCLLSGAARRPFPHNDWAALDRMLGEMRYLYRRCVVIVEGVYSMDGDIPDLPRFIEVKRRHKALLMVDEAHSIGVLGKTGRGIVEHSGVDAADVDILMGTLSKSMSSCGGYIAGKHALVEYLKYTAPGFVFSVGITPANTGAALASLRTLKEDPGPVEKLRQNGKLFLNLAKDRGFDTGTSGGTPIIPIILGDSRKCLALSQAMYDRDINVQPIVYPAVDESAARLRFFLSALHSEKQLRDTVEIMAEELEKIKG